MSDVSFKHSISYGTPVTYTRRSTACLIIFSASSFFLLALPNQCEKNQNLQALGVAVKSLMITMMRNIVLFIPVVILLNSLWKLNGVIAAQPVVETILAIVCIVMYARNSKMKIFLLLWFHKK